jgi:hypothetical protein
VTETTPDEDVRFVLRNELRLYEPGVRGAPGELEALLHPDFVEFGPLGLRWDRREIIAALTGPGWRLYFHQGTLMA